VELLVVPRARERPVQVRLVQGADEAASEQLPAWAGAPSEVALRPELLEAERQLARSAEARPQAMP
jgi:hypothetical protein